MKKILHLSADEKFIDMGLNAFEMAYPKKNSLLLVQKHNTIKHVKFENKKIINKQTLDKASRKSEFWTDVDVVVFHSLFVYKVVVMAFQAKVILSEDPGLNSRNRINIIFVV